MFAEELEQLTKKAVDIKEARLVDEALEYLKTIKDSLRQAAANGLSESIIDLKDREDLFIRTIQKELKKEGLTTENLKNNQLKISWGNTADRIPGELFSWYELENSIDERNTQINFASTNLEEVKENMNRFSDWYRSKGTGTIFKTSVIEKDNQIITKRRKVFRM